MSVDTFDSSGATSASDLELSSHATRIQRLMLALIPHFDPTDDLIRILRHAYTTNINHSKYPTIQL